MKDYSRRTSDGHPSSEVAGRAVKRSLALEPRVLLDAAAADTALAAAAGAEVALSAAQGSAGATHEVVFIDASVSNLSQLLQGIDLQRYDVHILDSSRDGLAQMADILASTQGVTAVHLVSHGADGAVQLGATTLTASNLATASDLLARIGQALAPEADILLYGCNIAADASGRGFIQALASATAHDVAASDDVTGLTGDWDLEYHQGLIQAEGLHLTGYDGDLNLDGVSAGTVSGVASQEFGAFVDADGAWVVAGGGNTAVSGGPTVSTWIVNGTNRVLFPVSRPDTTNWSTSFGQGVAIDDATSTLVIADPAAGTNGKLAVYKLARDVNGNITGWNFVQTLTPAVGRIGPSSSGFGKDYLDISGNHIVVGAPNEGGNSGAVIWFSDTSGGNWSTYASGYFNEPESLNSDSPERFGTSVAVAGDYLVVSAAGADTNGDDGYAGGGDQGNFGRVYIYQWTANSPTGPGGATNNGTTATRFTAGAPSPAAWNYLSGQDDMNGLDGGGGLVNQWFGASVAMDYYGGKYTIAIGAPGDGSNDGKVYIYQTTTSDMSTLGYNANTSIDGCIGIFNLSTANAGSRAGFSVDVSQGRIIVGVPYHTTTTQNALWYFEASNNNWNALQSTNNDVDASVGTNFTSRGIIYKTFSESLIPGHTNGGDRLGFSVAIAGGNLIAVGTPYFNTGAAGAPGAVDFLYAHTPVAVNDTATIDEDTYKWNYSSIDILANDLKGTEVLGTSVGANTFTVTVNSVNGFGDAYWDTGTNRLRYRVGTADGTSGGASNYNYLAVGETATVTIGYTLTGDDLTTSGLVTVTITGNNDAPTFVNGSIPALSSSRTIDPNVSAAGGVVNGGTVGYFAGDTAPSYQIQVGSFVDPDTSNTLTYALDLAATNALGNPAALAAGNISISAAGLVTWNLPGTLPTGTYTIVVKATDNGSLTASGQFQFVIQRDDIRPEVQTANLPAGNTLTWTQNVPTTQSVLTWFRDVDTSNAYSSDESLRYSISYTGPGSNTGWLSIRSDTGLLQGTPGNDNVGDTTVTITVTDKYGQRVSQNITLTVKNVNDAPILNGSIDPVQAGQGTAFSFQVPGWSTTGSAANEADDLFEDPDNPGSVITYTAALVDAAGNLIRNLTSSPGGTGAGSWLTFSGGTYNPTTFATTGTATFGGTSTDPIGTRLYVRITATDSGTSWNGSGFVSDPKSTSYTFTLQTFAPTISLSPAGATGITAAAELGTAVAISRDGTYMVVGAPNDSQKGTVVSYFWNGTAWAQMSTAFTVPAGVAIGDRFGQAVALDYNGDRLLVGAPGTATGAGTVYAFTRTGSGATATWALAATYTEAGAGNTRNASDAFGTTLAFYTDANNANDGQSFIVGAPYDSDSAAASGKAFLYGWGNTTPVATISPATDAGDSNTAYDQFGFSVSYSGNVAVIGAPGDTHDGYFMAGSATVVAINNPTTTSPSVLNSAKITRGNKSAFYDMFGYSVSLQLFDGIGNAANVWDSALLAVGAPGNATLAYDAGAVFLYRADNLVAQAATRATVLKNATPTVITAYDGRSFQYFGSTVAVSVANNVEGSGTNRFLVGSQQTADSTGSVYMFKYTTAWNGQRFVPTGSGAVAGMQFGRAIDLAVLPGSNNPNWVAGAPYAGATSYDGRVYLSNAAAATALSLDSGSGGGSGGGLIPMGATTADTGTTTSTSTSTAPALVPMSTTSTMQDPVAPAATTTSVVLTPLSAPATGTSGSGTTGTGTSSSSTQSFSDLLLMDMLTTDPLSTGTTDTTCTAASGSCLADAGPVPVSPGLSQQLQLMQARRQHGALALLQELEALVS